MQLRPIEQCRSDLELHGLTTCAQCNDLIHQSEAVILVWYTRCNEQEQEAFCGDDCKYSWRLDRMRALGL